MARECDAILLSHHLYMIERSIQYDYLITGDIVIGMITGDIDPSVSLVSNQVLAQLFQFRRRFI